MEYRTDLAVEAREACPKCAGVAYEERSEGDVRISRITVDSDEGAQSLGKPRGCYVTVELPPLTDNAFAPDERYECVSAELVRLLPKSGLVLTVGLGNRAITPDALGPRAASQVVATRHITEELRRSAGFTALRPSAVFAPGVLGKTGMESAELLRAVCGLLHPAAVVIIDAMASRRLSRLGCTVQISDAGISPGAGVGNNRPSISQHELGVPVVSVGVPTVVEATTLAYDLTGDSSSRGAVSPRGAGMIVTPREIDLLIDRASRLIALAVNHAFHPTLDPIELLSMA